MLVTQSSPTLFDPVDCSPPGSSVHGDSQARILEWVAIPFSRDLPNPEIEPSSPALQADFFKQLSHKGSKDLLIKAVMRNAGLGEAQAGIRIAGRNINNLRYADDTFIAESEEELKSLLMKVKEESENLA